MSLMVGKKRVQPGGSTGLLGFDVGNWKTDPLLPGQLPDFHLSKLAVGVWKFGYGWSRSSLRCSFPRANLHYNTKPTNFSYGDRSQWCQAIWYLGMNILFHKR